MCRSVSALSDTRSHTRSMRYVFGRRARALCSRGNGVRSLWAFFLWEKAPLSVVPFSRENCGNHLPPAARVQPLLRQWRDWVRGDRRWSLRMSLRERKNDFFHLALDSGWREWTAGGRCIVCYIFWSSRKCFAGSWCASRDVELLEVMKRALLLGKPTVDARKRGSGSQ